MTETTKPTKDILIQSAEAVKDILLNAVAIKQMLGVSLDVALAFFSSTQIILRANRERRDLVGALIYSMILGCDIYSQKDNHYTLALTYVATPELLRKLIKLVKTDPELARKQMDEAVLEANKKILGNNVPSNTNDNIGEPCGNA